MRVLSVHHRTNVGTHQHIHTSLACQVCECVGSLQWNTYCVLPVHHYTFGPSNGRPYSIAFYCLYNLGDLNDSVALLPQCNDCNCHICYSWHCCRHWFYFILSPECINVCKRVISFHWVSCTRLIITANVSAFKTIAKYTIGSPRVFLCSWGICEFFSKNHSLTNNTEIIPLITQHTGVENKTLCFLALLYQMIKITKRSDNDIAHYLPQTVTVIRCIWSGYFSW